jgi:hypothetical protein
VNGDGRNDFLVGAPGNDTNGPDAGAVYVYFGGPTVDGNPDLVLHGDAGRFGDAVAAADLDGDGFQDIIVGAPLRSPGGRVFVFRGGSGILDANSDWVLDGTVAAGRFGTTLATGDFDADGRADVAVGTLAAAPTNGEVWLFRGGPGFDTQADGLLLGPDGIQFGCALASQTDVAGDPRIEIAVGARGAPGGGRVYLYNVGSLVPTDVGPGVKTPAITVTGCALGRARDLGSRGVWIDYVVDAHAPKVSLDVFNTAGRFVRSLVYDAPSPGSHTAVWDGRDSGMTAVSRGVYFVRMRAGTFEATRKIVKTH